MPKVDFEIKGIEEVSAKIEQVVSDLQGGPFLEGMRDATLLVLTDAKRYAPGDTGRLRASIAPEVRTQGKEVIGVVGSNVKYAFWVEEGTAPHWVPKGTLAVWARRHGMEEGTVRHSIGTFGTSKMAFKQLGTKGYRYLQRAFEENIEKIHKLIGDVVGKIVSK